MEHRATAVLSCLIILGKAWLLQSNRQTTTKKSLYSEEGYESAMNLSSQGGNSGESAYRLFRYDSV
jgi:hypothetical protein